MQVDPTPLPGLLLITPVVHRDGRGHFLETFNERMFQERTGARVRFVQDNESLSSAGTLRGLHFQARPHAQAKLVRVVRGAVLDVCVDLRPGSPTRGRHFKCVLDEGDRRMLYIPEGFAHGFHTLEDGTIFSYKCSGYYHRPAERTLLWNDPDLGIDWGAKDPLLSEKDRQGMTFASRSWIDDV